jgi:tetratricopeptide (TPR) repeat protein
VSNTSQIDSLDKDQINTTLLYFTRTERKMGAIHKRRNEFNLAEDYCQRALTYARLFEGEEELKTSLLYSALIGVYDIYKNQGKYDEAFILDEEAYNCVAVTYNPVHPNVQHAASSLIECLIDKGDFDHAETFAQLTLESLKDPGNGLDQQSEAVAQGYCDLGNAIFQQKEDLVKAEKLVRESLRIRTRLHGGDHEVVGVSSSFLARILRARLHGGDHEVVGVSSSFLARILRAQGKLGIETKELYERCVAINIKNFGSEGMNTAASNFNLGNYYYQQAEASLSAGRRKEHLSLSFSKLIEALRINTKFFGPDNPKTMQISSQLSIVSHKLSEA